MGIGDRSILSDARNLQAYPKHAAGNRLLPKKIQPRLVKVSNVELTNIDQVPSNAHHSEKESQLYIFEDNEAVIKMIIKARSPTMRHVSRTHRGALDWLFDIINLDPKVQIKYVESKNQLADILTKGNFTRVEGNHLLHLFNIMSNTTFFFVPKRKQSVAMSKRSQESFSTDDSPAVKARSRTFNLVSQQCWSGKQSLSTSNSTIPESTRTEGVSSSIGKPLSESTSKNSMLGSQVDG